MNSYHFRVLIFICILLSLFIYAYSPAFSLQFRAEQWAIYDYYLQIPFPSSIEEWFYIAFWTPFRDYRFIPLAYIWNYLEVVLFQVNFSLYTALSLSLYFLNAVLLAFLAKRYANGFSATFWVALIMALFLPSALEIATWSFFSYKLFQVTLVLTAILLLEHSLTENKPWIKALSISVMFLSTLFYEAMVPILVLFALRMVWKRWYQWPWALVCFLFLVIYAFLSWYFEQQASTFGVQGNNTVIPSVSTIIASAKPWIWQDWVLANSGIYVEFKENTYYAVMHLIDPTEVRLLLVVFGWAAVLSGIYWRRVNWKSVVWLFSLLFACSLPVLIGRTATNGIDYLSGFSMYNYHAVIFLSGIVSIVVSSGWEKVSIVASSGWKEQKLHVWRHRISIIGFILLSLAWITSTRHGVDNYLQVNVFHTRLMNLTADIIKNTERTIVPLAKTTPYNTTALPPTLNFFYSALHLVHGKRISSSMPDDTNFFVFNDQMIDAARKNREIGFRKILDIHDELYQNLVRLCTDISNNTTRVIIPRDIGLIGFPKELLRICGDRVSPVGPDTDFFILDRHISSIIYQNPRMDFSDLLARHDEINKKENVPVSSVKANKLSHVQHPLAYLTDNRLDTIWSSISQDSPNKINLIFDLGSNFSTKGLSWRTRGMEAFYAPDDVVVMGSVDGLSWLLLGKFHGSPAIDTEYSINWDPILVRYIQVSAPARLNPVLGDFMLQIAEVLVKR